MLRQVSNLIHTGRLRTCSSTSRARKPAILRANPNLELHNFLELAIAQLGVAPEEFFFIQVGAYDGLEADHLHALIRRHHWRGILVEPQPEAFRSLQTNYQGEEGLQFFNVAIGPQNGSIAIYTRRGASVPIASVNRRLLVKPGHSAQEITSIEVPCWTLDRLLEEASAPASIDLLQIDTEGYDCEILRSIDFLRVRPKIIRYEHALLSERQRNECIRLLGEQGYLMLLEDCDTIAIRREFAGVMAG